MEDQQPVIGQQQEIKGDSKYADLHNDKNETLMNEPQSQLLASSNVGLSDVVDHDDPFNDLGSSVHDNNVAQINDSSLTTSVDNDIPVRNDDTILDDSCSPNNESDNMPSDIASIESSAQPSNHEDNNITSMPASQVENVSENAENLAKMDQDEDVDESSLISSVNHDYDGVFTDSMIDSNNQGQRDEIAASSIADSIKNNNKQSDLLGSFNDIPVESSIDNDNQPIEMNESNNDEIATAAVYTASTTISETQENEEIMNAIPLMAATEAMASQNNDEILRTPATENYEIKPFDKYEQSLRQMGSGEQDDDNMHTIDIYEGKEIRTFDQYEKSCREMGYYDDNDDNDDDNNEVKELVDKNSDFHLDEENLKINNKNESKSRCWFNIAIFSTILVISGIIIALVVVLVPKNDSPEEDNAEPPKTQVLKHIIEGSCIKGQSIGMSSDGNKIIYINSDLQLDNQDMFNTSILLYDLNDNKTTLINSITNVESALIQTIPVTISSDGNTIAHTSYDIENFTNIHVYQADNDNYKPFGDSIQLARLSDIISLALSNYGNHLAIGNPEDIQNGINSGKASLYSHVDNKWNLHDDDIIGKANAIVGSSVALSYDEVNNTLIFAASAPTYDNIGSVFSNIYHVKDNFINFINQTAQEGIGKNTLFGTSISLSDDGHRMAIGSPDYNYDNTDYNGQCNVYEYHSDTLSWTSIGDSIIGENANYHLGYNVALSGDGKRLAISSKNPFIVTLYEYTNGNNWGMIGTNFTYPDHHNDMQFGSSISLNFDGSILAISANNGGANDSTNAKCGKIFVYTVDNQAQES